MSSNESLRLNPFSLAESVQVDAKYDRSVPPYDVGRSRYSDCDETEFVVYESVVKELVRDARDERKLSEGRETET
mgnify:CR=1 FL=1